MIELQKPQLFAPFPTVVSGLSLTVFSDVDAHNLGFDHLVLQNQVHGSTINEAEPGMLPETGDALITHTPGLLLGMRVADCAAVLLYDSANRIVANIHSGWRGSKAAIVTKTIQRLQEQFKSDPTNLWAYVSPLAQICCYEVGPDFIDNFDSKYLEVTKGKHFFNNQLVISDQLLSAGVPIFQIEFDPRCTIHDVSLTSYRRTQSTDRMLTVIGLH